MRVLFSALAVLFLALPLAAQHQQAPVPDPLNPEGADLETPPSWVVRLDRPSERVRIGSDRDSVEIYFVNMTPGWHITTGPAAIFYHPGLTASGTYAATAVLHLFDPEGFNEGFGMFFGGRNLSNDAVQYEYFLIRNSGQYLIKRRRGRDTETLRDWTEHPAIHRYREGTESVANELKVIVEDDEIVFLINDEEVDRLPADRMRTQGVVGVRANHRLNLHVEDLRVE